MANLSDHARMILEKNRLCHVLNLLTGNYTVYTCEPRQAVIAAYAQSLGNYNTWDYEARYGACVIETAACFHCGDFSVTKMETYEDGWGIVRFK